MECQSGIDQMLIKCQPCVNGVSIVTLIKILIECQSKVDQGYQSTLNS